MLHYRFMNQSLHKIFNLPIFYNFPISRNILSKNIRKIVQNSHEIVHLSLKLVIFSLNSLYNIIGTCIEI